MSEYKAAKCAEEVVEGYIRIARLRLAVHKIPFEAADSLSVDTGPSVDKDPLNAGPSDMDHDLMKRSVHATHTQAVYHDDHNIQWTLCYHFEGYHVE